MELSLRSRVSEMFYQQPINMPKGLSYQCDANIAGPQPGFFVCVCVCVWGGGGGGGWEGGKVRTSITRTKYFTVRMIRYASSEDTQGRVTKLRTKLKSGRLSMVGKICER